MSKQNDTRRDIFERVKVLAQLVDKVLVEVFPELGKLAIRPDGSEKPLAFAIIDNRLGKLELLKMMRQHADQQSLMAPYPGLWRLVQCERKQSTIPKSGELYSAAETGRTRCRV